MITKLFDTFQPKHYDLHLDLNAEASTFTGTVDITGTVDDGTSLISLHAKDLQIQKIMVNQKEASSYTHKKDDVLAITLESPISKEAFIEVTFSGTITDAMHGIYPCYFEKDGVKKKLLATQFESHHAREAFPCIDEPAAKATFDVTLTTAQNEVVLGNMPIKKQSAQGARTTTTFETTPVMSTYLLAFVTGDMVSVETKTKDGVTVRSWAAAHHKKSWLEYSLHETVRLIEFYNDYFGVAYPLEKCDQVALPDFESGAMENWGLITYRETVFLSDPENISLTTQQWVSLVIAHELSHQWFGNLVTMQWWDDLWLNESFANMTEYLAVDKLHPEWNIWEEFVASDVLSATNRDVYSDVQAVRVDVNDPAEVSTLFDPSIVYAKGGKLLRMLLELLGEDAWRAGLKDYFTTHAYQNTVRDDLWSALSRHTTVDVPALMNTWIEHPGQPLLSVDQNDGSVKLTQQRILLDGGEDETTWQIPTLTKDLPPLLKQKEEIITGEDREWVRLNVLGFGHYITNYLNSGHKNFLAQLLADSNVESSWKISRLNELVMLAKHGDTDLTEALDAIQHCSQEKRAMVWTLIAGIVGNARMLTEGDDQAEASVKQLSFNLVHTLFEELGWEYPADEESNLTHLRTIATRLMVSSEDHESIQEALKRFRDTEDPELLSAESRSLILGVVAKFGTDEEFTTLLRLHEKTQSPDYRSDLCSAICSTRDLAKITQLHQRMVNPELVKPQDLRQWFVYLLSNRYGREATWQWLRDNWNWIIENFGGSKTYDDFARYSANFLSTQKQFEEYVSFFSDKKDDPSLKRAIAIGTEEIKARVAWRTRDQAKVIEWLKEYSAKNL